MKGKPLIISAAIFISFCFATIAALAQEGDEPEPAPDTAATNIGPAFTYQGYLEQSGAPVDGTCDFDVRLFDTAVAGTQIGSGDVDLNQTVTNGRFTLTLNDSGEYGATVFNGQERWLEILVRCPAGSSSYTTLDPRQPLTAAPYALALPGLWTQQNATSPNLIGGFGSNVMGNGVSGGVISGGGTSGFANQVFDNYGTISGGRSNTAGSNDGNTTNQDFATVSGGDGNTANGRYAVVSGGFSNTSSSSSATVSGGLGNNATAVYSSVGGGWNNTASAAYTTVDGGASNIAGGSSSTVSGGFENNVSGNVATIGGGSNNIAVANYATIAGGGPWDTSNPTITNNRAYDDYGTISGGGGNVVGIDDNDTGNQKFSTVGGGSSNTASGWVSTVSGGVSNTASGSFANVGGGSSNTASNSDATVGGGLSNTASGSYATVGGGSYNTASAYASVVGGGSSNTANGNYATAGGGANNTANNNYATVGGGENNQSTTDYAAVGGGSSNIASGSASTVGGGADNTAGGAYATVPGGSNGAASHYGEQAYASGSFATVGDAQTSLYVLRQETADENLTEMFLDGSAERITLAVNRVMTFDILVVGSHLYSGSAAGYQVTGVIRNNNGATTFVGTPVVTTLGESVASWDVQVTADNTFDALVVKVQGSIGTTVRWVASVRTVEMAR